MVAVWKCAKAKGESTAAAAFAGGVEQCVWNRNDWRGRRRRRGGGGGGGELLLLLIGYVGCGPVVLLCVACEPFGGSCGAAVVEAKGAADCCCAVLCCAVMPGLFVGKSDAWREGKGQGGGGGGGGEGERRAKKEGGGRREEGGGRRESDKVGGGSGG